MSSSQSSEVFFLSNDSRQAAERAGQSDQIRGDVVKQLIPLVDSFEAAQSSIKAETEEEKQRASAYQVSHDTPLECHL